MMPSTALMHAAATPSLKVTPYPGRTTPGRAKYAGLVGDWGRGGMEGRGGEGEGGGAEIIIGSDRENGGENRGEKGRGGRGDIGCLS